MHRPFASLVTAVLLAISAGLAQAHTGDTLHTPMHSFASGLLHPWLGPDHLLAMLAIGVWSAVSSHRPWVAPLAFANMLLLGMFLALGGYQVPAVEPLVAATLLALGLLVATRARLPEPAAVALAGGFAVLHGMAHGAGLTLGVQPGALVQTLLGVVTGTVLLHALGLGLGAWLRRRAPWWVRVTGSGVALTGSALLAQMA